MSSNKQRDRSRTFWNKVLDLSLSYFNPKNRDLLYLADARYDRSDTDDLRDHDGSNDRHGHGDMDNRRRCNHGDMDSRHSHAGTDSLRSLDDTGSRHSHGGMDTRHIPDDMVMNLIQEDLAVILPYLWFLLKFFACISPLLFRFLKHYMHGSLLCYCLLRSKKLERIIYLEC